jgi:hypothetical protein
VIAKVEEARTGRPEEEGAHACGINVRDPRHIAALGGSISPAPQRSPVPFVGMKHYAIELFSLGKKSS